jgi:hypothetical protein
MVQIMGNVEDEHSLSILAFMKSHLCDKLTHLHLVVWMFTQRFYIVQKFMHAYYIEKW